MSHDNHPLLLTETGQVLSPSHEHAHSYRHDVCASLSPYQAEVWRIDYRSLLGIGTRDPHRLQATRFVEDKLQFWIYMKNESIRCIIELQKSTLLDRGKSKQITKHLQYKSLSFGLLISYNHTIPYTNRINLFEDSPTHVIRKEWDATTPLSLVFFFSIGHLILLRYLFNWPPRSIIRPAQLRECPEGAALITMKSRGFTH